MLNNMNKMNNSNELKDIDGIIFDLDGTLWDSTTPICEAWNIILEKHPEIKREPITEKDLFDCMGKPMYDIAAMLFPDESKETQVSIMDELCSFENDYLAERGAVLYPELENVLAGLAKKYPLYIVSNCQDGYIEAFIKAHKLEKYFKDTECWGRTRLPKGESNKILMKRNGLRNPVYVGDTAGDAQSAIDAGIPFIYASYGFGSVDKHAAKIDSISELASLL